MIHQIAPEPQETSAILKPMVVVVHLNLYQVFAGDVARLGASTTAVVVFVVVVVVAAAVVPGLFRHLCACACKCSP